MGEFLYLANLNFLETWGFPLVKLTPCDIIWIPQGSKNQIWWSNRQPPCTKVVLGEKKPHESPIWWSPSETEKWFAQIKSLSIFKAIWSLWQCSKKGGLRVLLFWPCYHVVHRGVASKYARTDTSLGATSTMNSIFLCLHVLIHIWVILRYQKGTVNVDR